MRECRPKNECDSLNIWSAKSLANVNRRIVFLVHVNRLVCLISAVYIYSPYVSTM